MFDFYPDKETGLDDYADGTKLIKKGICKKLIYAAPDDGLFAIYIFEDEDDNEYKIKGNIKEMNIGSSYSVEGTVRTYNGEKQLSIYTFLECRPCNKNAIIAYLQTLPGLNSKAEVIFDHFGMDSVEVLEHHPEQLATIKGIGMKSVEKWSEAIKKTIGKKYAILELLEYGFTQKQCMTLLSNNDTTIIGKIRANPYCLIYSEKGFGFITCDNIAMKMGYNFNHPNRIFSAAQYLLEQAGNEGHVYLPVEDVITKSVDLLSLKLSKDEINKLYNEGTTSIVKFNREYELDLNELAYCLYNDETYILEKMPRDEIENIIMDDNRFVYYEDGRLYSRKLYMAECSIATKVVTMCKRKQQVFSREEVEAVLDIVCKTDHIELEAMQRLAIITFNMYDSGMFILNGSAGTGKTFVINLVLKVSYLLNKAYHRNYKITLLPMAPTGKAARVMSKSINRPAKTIHRGLQYTEAGFVKNYQNPFDENTICVDETSMLDTELAAHLLEAVRPDTKLIFIGDTKQLPSVGPGKVLRDLIDSEIPLMVTLNVVKRQGKFSGIIRNANRIIAGEEIISEMETDDFYIYEDNNYQSIQANICNQVETYTKQYGMSDVQVLSPQRPGPLGVNMLNYLIQQRLNPINEDELYVKKGTFDSANGPIDINFHEGDKVINVKNDYNKIQYDKNFGQYIETKELGITNGECGIVDAIRKNEETKRLEVVVKFDDCYIIYDEFSNLDLAYALTIHKSQGSQWPIVIMPVVMAHNFILSNNLIYTAVTRASKKCFIYGQKFAIKHAIETFKEDVRNTTLKEKIIEEWNAFEDTF